jgi:outer membrane protein assembly factor BamE (lipoprotein component of BamABCDE complex)
MHRNPQTALPAPPSPLVSLACHGPRAAVAALALAAALAAVTLSCATIGNRFPPENVARVKIGETTKAQLLGDFGLPYRRGIEDGDSTWTYVYYKVRLFGENLRTRDLYLRFDPDGRVKSYTYNSNLDD